MNSLLRLAQCLLMPGALQLPSDIPNPRLRL